MTNQQVAAFDDGPSLRLDPLALAENGHGAALEWLQAQPAGSTPMIYATADPQDVRAAQDKLSAARAGELVEAALADLAGAAFAAGRRRFVIAGGETSGAVAKTLGLSRLDIGAPRSPRACPGHLQPLMTSRLPSHSNRAISAAGISLPQRWRRLEAS